MAIKIPQSVFDKYYEVVDSTFDIFGVMCQLAYIDTLQEIPATSGYMNIVPTDPSISMHRHNNALVQREGRAFQDVERLEDVKMKVYWDAKHFTNVGGDMVLPDGAIQTIFFATDLARVMQCKNLIAHKGIEDLIEYRFQRVGDPFPMGIGLTRYFGCFWKRDP